MDPYGLVLSDGFWYLVGKCHLRGKVRVFAIDSIQEIEKSARSFEYPENFDLEDFFSSSFGIYTGMKENVTIQFYEPVAKHILRRKFHRSQKNELQADGSVISTFEVFSTEEIKRWLYKWIPDFRVLKPDSLKREMYTDVRAFMKNLITTNGGN